MAKTLDSVAQEIQKVELTIKNVRKDIKSAKKKVANCKKSLKKEKQFKKELESELAKTTAERDRVLAEYNAMCAKIAEYQQFCEGLNGSDTTGKDPVIEQAEKLLFAAMSAVDGTSNI